MAGIFARGTAPGYRSARPSCRRRLFSRLCRVATRTRPNILRRHRQRLQLHHSFRSPALGCAHHAAVELYGATPAGLEIGSSNSDTWAPRARVCALPLILTNRRSLARRPWPTRPHHLDLRQCRQPLLDGTHWNPVHDHNKHDCQFRWRERPILGLIPLRLRRSIPTPIPTTTVCKPRFRTTSRKDCTFKARTRTPSRSTTSPPPAWPSSRASTIRTARPPRGVFPTSIIASALSPASTTALPFLANRHDAMGYVLGGWEVNSVIVAQSGSPITIVDGNGGVGL